MRVILLVRLFLLIALAGFELGFVATLPWPWSLTSPMMLFLIFSTVTHRNALPWIAAIISGFIFDAFSMFPTGTYTLLFVALVGLTQFLFFRFFTNRSLLVFITLGAIGSAFLFGMLTLVRFLTFLATKNPLLTIDTSLVLAVLGVGILINSLLLGLVVFLSHYLKNYTLRRRAMRRIRA